MRFLEMRLPHEITRQKAKEKILSRRRFLKLGIASVISMGLQDNEPSAYQQIGNFEAETYAHNVDTLSDLDRIRGARYIEIDECQLETGEIVIGHSVKEFKSLPLAIQSQQKPWQFIDKIRSFGGKVHIDTKREPDEEEIKDKTIKEEHDRIFRDHILEVAQGGHTTVSGPDHDFLWSLVSHGFSGRILFTLRTGNDVKNFLEKYDANSFAVENEGEGKRIEYGVSIRFTKLSDSIADQLQERGLYVLAWTPNTSAGILSALQRKVNGITSDMPRLLKQIGSNLQKAA